MTTVAAHGIATRGGLARVGLIVATGAGAGLLLGGVLGRLLMFALIRLNPENVGMLSDDGFEMGRFTLSGSLNLLVVGAVIGGIGGLVYAGARHLTFGPTWFRASSIVLGSGLPVGALIVQTEGVDFVLLSPGLLGVAMFVSIPALYGLTLWLVLEHRLPPPPQWGRLEPLRWAVRAGATAVLVVALVDLVRDIDLLT